MVRNQFFCCSDCVWFDDGKKQNCLKCAVNVKTCSCFEYSSDTKHTSNKLNMQNVEDMFKYKKKIYFKEKMETNLDVILLILSV